MLELFAKLRWFEVGYSAFWSTVPPDGWGDEIDKPAPVVEATVRLGYPESVIQSLGIVLLVCTILYAIPRTHSWSGNLKDLLVPYPADQMRM
jgi:hypothetical protein